MGAIRVLFLLSLVVAWWQAMGGELEALELYEKGRALFEAAKTKGDRKGFLAADAVGAPFVPARRLPRHERAATPRPRGG